MAGCGTDREEFIFPTPDPTPTPAPSIIPPATLIQPPQLRSAGGSLSTTFNVGYVETTVETAIGPKLSRLRTWNGYLGGPTLRVRPGDRLTIQVNNGLPPNEGGHFHEDMNVPHDFNSINLHTHGFHVSPEQDDVISVIEPGESRTYVYDIPEDHSCGTYWYHAHKHGATAMHLFSGMAGLLIVEGEVDNDPPVAAATDLDFVIQELNLRGIGSDPPADEPYEVPDYVVPRPFAQQDGFSLVNGAYQPTIRALPGRTVRLRVLNASTRNTMPIAVPGQKLNVISLDGLTLPRSKELDSIQLAPANRADIVLKIDEPGTYRIIKEQFQNGGGAPDPEETLAFIEITDGQNQAMELPDLLTTPRQLPTITQDEITERRTLVYAVNDPNALDPQGPIIGGQAAPNFTINGARFDPTVINHTIELDAVVEWTLYNTSSAWHFDHIHVNPFQVVESSDGRVNGFPLTEPVWLDTVDIPPNGHVVLRQRFPDFTGLFVLHCHILVHEDIGMMQLVNVVPKGTPIPDPMIPPTPPVIQNHDDHIH